MMYNYPFFSFPHFGRYSHYSPVHYSVPNHSINTNHVSSIKTIKEPKYEPSKNSTKEKSSVKRAPTGFSFLNNFLHQEDRSDDEKFFDIFGLKLYDDDILLLGLIFFLYKEEVKDQYLFFALVLLLLS